MEKKVVIITGAGSGIGKACVQKFLDANYYVVMIGRNEAKLKELFMTLNSENVIYFKGDVSIQEQVDNIINNVVGTYGQIDVVVNNAGICTSVPFIDMTYNQYDEVIKVNQYGTFFCMQAAAKKMIDLKIKGVIINVSSVFYDVASPLVFHYHASKGAIVSMTKSAALELAPYGIRVIAVAPGVIDTPMMDIDKQRGSYEEIQKKHMRLKALLPEDVANAIVFLSSEKAYGINACTIPIDDGLLSKY